jgi:cell division protein FtsB
MKRRRTLRLPRPARSTLGWMGAVAAAAALQVWVQLQATELGYQIGLLRGVLQQLADEKAELEAELAGLTSPRALDVAARTRLGLRPPEPGQVVGVP